MGTPRAGPLPVEAAAVVADDAPQLGAQLEVVCWVVLRCQDYGHGVEVVEVSEAGECRGQQHLDGDGATIGERSTKLGRIPPIRLLVLPGDEDLHILDK